MDLHSYYMTETNKRLDQIDQKLDSVLKFKWQIIGGSFAVSLVGSVVISLISAYYYLGFVK